ncbi:chitin deacetylase, partial [Lunasporangiospora selenospora]
WSHSGLTTLTNEEVVGELMWTQKYIYDHTGYKISYFRPPYGDIDNRVRAIARQLGFKTVIWSHNWDTQDWQLPEKTITQKQVVGIFKKGLSDLSARKRGVITLEHDGDKQMTNMARTLLDMGIKYGMKPMDIPKCMGDPIGYNEVPEDAVLPAPAPAPKKPAPPARQPPPSSPNVPVPASLKPGKVAKPAENIKPASINQDSPIKQASDNTDDSIQKTGTTEQGELSSLGDNKTSFAVPFGASYSSWSMACWTAAALLLGWTI